MPRPRTLLLLTAIWLALGAGVARASSWAAPQAARHSTLIASAAALTQALDRQLAYAGGASSALVIDASTGRVLFAHDAGAPRLPASVEKLFTTSAALWAFGSAHRFTTRVEAVGAITGANFSGDLYLRGGGDPTFGDAHFDAVQYGTGATVQTLLANLRRAGIHRLAGRILGDASIFDTLGGGPDTGYRANVETEGELSGLAYDGGWTSSAETALQPDPALWATRAFASAAEAAGITVARGARIGLGRTPAGARLLAQVSSPDLSTLIALTNAPSDNFFAETLDKDLGAADGTGGSTSAGAAVVTRVIAERLGLPVHADDGSGLSRSDRSTAMTIAQLLEEMDSSPAFLNSLAIAGKRGTMSGEMLGTRAVDNCRGKTGTLHDVANLVGYCTAANGDHLVFAFLENGLSDADFGHLTEDQMGIALADYDGPGAGIGPAPSLPEPDAGARVPLQVAGGDPTVPPPGARSGSGSQTGTGTGGTGDGGGGL